MFYSVTIIFLLTSTILCDDFCNEHVHDSFRSCIRNVTQDYDMRRYEDIRNGKTLVTDTNWQKHMLAKCDNAEAQRRCVADFLRQCSTLHTKGMLHTLQINGLYGIDSSSKTNCYNNAKKIATGCGANFSIWSMVCESPFLEQVYSMGILEATETGDSDKLVISDQAKPLFEKKRRYLCCELQRYSACMMARAKTECNAAAVDIIKGDLNDLYSLYGNHRCAPVPFVLNFCFWQGETGMAIRKYNKVLQKA